MGEIVGHKALAQAYEMGKNVQTEKMTEKESLQGLEHILLFHHTNELIFVTKYQIIPETCVIQISDVIIN